MIHIKKLSTLGLFLSLAPTIACDIGSPAVTQPTWLEDVRPIVQANCLRCHTPPSIGGAPTDFRLDVYEDTPLADGRVIRGARTMARFIAYRAGEQGTMPPDFPRNDGQRDTLINWWENGAALGGQGFNSLPQAELLSELSQADQDPVALEYEARDADGDLVSGSIRVGDRVVAELVKNGRGTATVNPATLEDGDYPIVASLTDDLSRRDVTIGTLVVRHADGNTAPEVALGTSFFDGLFADLQFPLDIGIAIVDPDAGDALTFDIAAFRGDDEVQIAEAVAATSGENTFTWASAADLPEGPGWRLRITARDGTASTRFESDRFYVSHQSTQLTYADVEPLLYEACAACHRDAEIPGPTAPNFIAGPDAKGQVDLLRGRLLRRVVLERTMPPPSARAIAQRQDLPWRALSDNELATLREYLLGGSPD